MKKRNNHRKILLITLSIFFIAGCGTFQTRHYYSPQNAPNWKNLGGRSFQFNCNDSKIEIMPIVLSTNGILEQKKPWIYINIQSLKRVENCDTSFILLRDRSSGKTVVPMRAETNTFNDDYFEKKTTYCYYYFDIEAEKNLTYDLFISDELLGCKVDPIPYKYEETTEWVPIQIM